MPEWIEVRSSKNLRRFFLHSADGKEKFFSEVVDGIMSDILILPISRDRRFHGIKEYLLHDNLSVPCFGDQLLMAGFPGSDTPVPEWPEREVRLVVTGANERVLVTKDIVEPGASGAPCETESGELAGMAIGVTNGLGVIVAAPLIREIIIKSQGNT